MTVKAISPDEIGAEKSRHIPDAVIESFNKLIALNFVGRSATVKQEDVLKEIVERGIERSVVFDNGYLNVEDVYRQQGWSVEYDKPGYNESYGAFFVFKKR